MRTRYFSFLIFLLVMTSSKPAFPIEKETNLDAAQNVQALRTIKSFIGRLGQRDTLGEIESIFHAADNGLNTLILPLLDNKTPPLPRAGGVSHAQELGFDTGINGAKFRRTPYPIFYTTLNDLHSFTPSKEAITLMTYTQELLFPVEVADQVKSSVTVRFIPNTRERNGEKEKETGWQLTRWGQPNLIGLLINAKAALEVRNPTLQSTFLLKIPALNRVFLGYDDNGVIRLIPLVNDHIFTRGESYASHDVFKWLSTEAKNMDDSPR